MNLYLLLRILIIASVLTVMPSYVICSDLVQGITKLKGQLTDGTSVNAEVKKIKIAPRYPYKLASMWGGDEISLPKTVITEIKIWIGGEKIFVPLSAYSDFGNPHQALLENTEHGFKLIITGGDAAVSYKAVIAFTKESIQRRKVTHGEFPDQVWEETVYSFISKDDER